MPYIRVRTTEEVKRDQELTLKAALGEAIALIPGKTERWLMVDLEGEAHLWLGGKEGKLAMVEVEIFGAAAEEAYDRLTAEICRILNEVLGVPGSGVYVKYAEKKHWGYDGSNF